MEKTVVFNIQRFCLHDGDGIRTTIFFKGCPLGCKWCHNPEGRTSSPQTFHYPDKCHHCGNCAEDCIYGAREAVGRDYTTEELIDIARRDMPFYRSSGGGVTLSGGEVMAQSRNFLIPLMRGLKQNGIHIAVDTCGHAPFEAFEDILPYTDVFLYDIKMIDRERHFYFTGQYNELILTNLMRLSTLGVPLNVRIPVIEGVNADDVEINNIIEFLSKITEAKMTRVGMTGIMKAEVGMTEAVNAEVGITGIRKISLLRYHALGMDKYKRLGFTPEGVFTVPDEARMMGIAMKFKQSGFTVEF